MLKYGAVMGLAGLCAVLTVYLCNSDPTKSDKVRLEGTWVLVGSETRGRPFSAEEIKKSPMTWIVRGQHLRALEEDSSGRPVEEEYDIRLNPSRTPQALDLVLPDGGVNHAIYSLNGDELIVCGSDGFGKNEPHERPIRFTTVQGQNNGLFGLILYRFRRDRDGRSSIVGRAERFRVLPPTGTK